jgi:hypothetical protein
MKHCEKYNLAYIINPGRILAADYAVHWISGGAVILSFFGEYEYQ